MNNRERSLIFPDFNKRIFGLLQNGTVRAILQILFVLGMGLLATVGKKIHPAMGIPGSSAVFWLVPLVLGRAIVRRDGTGVFMGASMAFFAMPIGLNNAFLHNFALYGLTGFALDVAARLPKIDITKWYGAIICGTLAHMVKFGFILGASLSSSIAKHFVIVGIMQSFALHLAFGIASGLLGWIAYRIYDSAKRKKPQDRSSV